MDSVRPDHYQDLIEDVSHQQSMDSNSSDICDVFGDPEIPSRLGDHYQAEIPLSMTGCNIPWPTKKVEPMGSDPNDFLVGLDIPITWVNDESSNNEGNFSGRSGKNRSIKVEPSDITSYDEVTLLELKNSSLLQKVRNEKCGKYKAKRYCLVPGSSGEQWSEIEKASFVLGLYIFGKNLVQVMKFIDCKMMGDILLFYYGRFYGSKEYRRWSECRKIRSRRCAFGQRIFTGSRQQELLSRLLPHLSVECQNTLMEASKAFGEGKIFLEQYVAALKSVVGMSKFIEAVGIGKGKQDLTGISGESSKSNQVPTGRPDMPIGKACSSLTHEEIVKLLIGDVRLSKARSRDLFWEAVWPRLLARGWNSEQPRNQSYASSSLVFLIPGVEKFSRRKLVKGTDYFDSVTDVLSKVASDTGILKLETEADTNNRSKEEYGSTDVTKVDEDNSSKQPSRYLQPRTPSRHKDFMKFTVVDTSLRNPKVRELRSLPLESSNVSKSISHSEDGEDISEGPTDEMNSSDAGDISVPKEFELSSPTGAISVASSESGDVFAECAKNQKTDLKSPRKVAKPKRMKPRIVGNIAPVTKRRRRLSSCGLKKERDSFCSGLPDSSETVVSEVEPSQEKGSLASSLCKGCPNSEGIEHFHEKHPCRTLFDLNVPPEFDIDKPLTLEKIESQILDSSNGHETVEDSGNIQLQPDVNPRRQSTRNRPPTTRALEALACGYLSSKKSRKYTDENSQSKPSRHVRLKVSSSKVEGRNKGCNNSSNAMFSQFQMEAPAPGP